MTSTHIVCNTKTAEIHHSGTERSCKMSKSRNGKYKNDDDVIVCTWEHYDKDINIEVERINIMSNKPFKINLRDVGGPCDPSTERYWCM